jgi:hypothetical protein
MPIDERRLARLARVNRAGVPTADGHKATVRALIDLADGSIVAGEPDDGAFLAGVAAEFAWLDHPGMFRDAGLESLLGRLRRTALASQDRHGSSGRTLGRGVVHVLTQAAELGGHSRLAWRWIDADPQSRHSVVLTQPPEWPIPAALDAAVRQAGGRVVRLRGSPRRRIAELARAVADADSVVMHVDPADVVAAAALSGSDRPPVMLVNHADHVFWAGADAADAVACIRTSGRDLAYRRRGVPASRLAMLPIPIPVPAAVPFGAGRSAARVALGIPNGSILIVSVASSYKFRPIAGVGMIDVAGAILAADPRFMLIVVGPVNAGPWAEIEARSGGRVRALGAIPNLRPIFAAADLYLDSYPFASLTSMLEAGSHGIPLVALQDHPAGCEILSSDSAGLTDMVAAGSVPELLGRLSELADHHADRAQLGQRTANRIATSHAGASWRASLAAAEEVARSSSGDRSPGHEALANEGSGSPEPLQTGQPGRLDELLIELHRGLGGLDHAIARRLVDRGRLDRLRLAANIGHEVWRAEVLAAFPPSVRRVIRSAIRRNR